MECTCRYWNVCSMIQIKRIRFILIILDERWQALGCLSNSGERFKPVRMSLTSTRVSGGGELSDYTIMCSRLAWLGFVAMVLRKKNQELVRTLSQ